jgi:hypothetical protein
MFEEKKLSQAQFDNCSRQTIVTRTECDRLLSQERDHSFNDVKTFTSPLGQSFDARRDHILNDAKTSIAFPVEIT